MQSGTNPNFCRSPTVYGFQTKAPGAFAQYVLRDEGNLSKLPSSMTYEQGALVEPLSVAYHTVWGLAGGVEPGETVVIFGAGPVGLLALAVVKGSRAKAISVDPIETRRELALRFGADDVIDPLSRDSTQEVLRLTGGRGQPGPGGIRQRRCPVQALRRRRRIESHRDDRTDDDEEDTGGDGEARREED